MTPDGVRFDIGGVDVEVDPVEEAAWTRPRMAFPKNLRDPRSKCGRGGMRGMLVYDRHWLWMCGVCPERMSRPEPERELLLSISPSVSGMSTSLSTICT